MINMWPTLTFKHSKHWLYWIQHLVRVEEAGRLCSLQGGSYTQNGRVIPAPTDCLLVIMWHFHHWVLQPIWWQQGYTGLVFKKGILRLDCRKGAIVDRQLIDIYCWKGSPAEWNPQWDGAESTDQFCHVIHMRIIVLMLHNTYTIQYNTIQYIYNSIQYNTIRLYSSPWGNSRSAAYIIIIDNCTI